MIACQPEHPQALAELGMVLADAGQLKDALGLVSLAIQLDPREPEFHARRAEIHRRVGDPTEVLEACLRARWLCADDARMQWLAGVALRRWSGCRRRSRRSARPCD